MDEKQFLENVADQFDDLDVDALTLDTVFKDLDDWSSLVALSIIAMADEEYDVILSGNDIRSANTLGDLLNLIKEKSA